MKKRPYCHAVVSGRAFPEVASAALMAACLDEARELTGIGIFTQSALGTRRHSPTSMFHLQSTTATLALRRMARSMRGTA